MKEYISKIEKVKLSDIERKTVHGQLVIYQEDLEKLLGHTLNVPGAYFNHEGGGKYWNAHGDNPEIYYYKNGCEYLLDILDVDNSLRSEIMEYFNDKNNGTLEHRKDDIGSDDILKMINKLDKHMKYKVIIYIDKLLNEKEEIEIEYKKVVAKRNL